VAKRWISTSEGVLGWDWSSRSGLSLVASVGAFALWDCGTVFLETKDFVSCSNFSHCFFTSMSLITPVVTFSNCSHTFLVGMWGNTSKSALGCD
jgi:hypothetical protein